MTIPVLDGITARAVTTDRLATRVLFSGPEDGAPVLFVHGNFSNATWWEETMLALPPWYRGIAPDLRGYGGADPAARIDATRGMRDFVDDLLALMDHLGYDDFHIVGISLGGLIVWWMMADAPHRLSSVTLAGPGTVIHIEPGDFRESVTVPTDGTEAAPPRPTTPPMVVQRNWMASLRYFLYNW